MVDKKGPEQRKPIWAPLWLKGMQGLISQALGRKARYNPKTGERHAGYFEGIHTVHQAKQVARRRARNKLAHKTRMAQAKARKGK